MSRASEPVRAARGAAVPGLRSDEGATREGTAIGRPAASEQVSRAIIGLGSNLGDRLGNLQAAVDAIAGLPEIWVDGVSPVYETLPVGGPAQPDYLNAVVAVRTMLPPRSLLDGLHGIEAAAGRVREVRWGARTLDLDIVSYGSVVSEDPSLTLPHPRAASRAFVLAPWHDLVPSAVVPGVGPVAALLARVGTDGVRRTDHVLRAPAA